MCDVELRLGVTKREVEIRTSRFMLRIPNEEFCWTLD